MPMSFIGYLQREDLLITLSLPTQLSQEAQRQQNLGPFP